MLIKMSSNKKLTKHITKQVIGEEIKILKKCILKIINNELNAN